MSFTYEDLKDEVLVLTDSVGATDIEAVVKIVLVRALKYISRKADLKDLVARADYEWTTSDYRIPLGGGGFEISDYEVPYFMMVGDIDDDTTRIPYHYLPYKDWLVLKGSGVVNRLGLDASIIDSRYSHCFTLNYDNEIEIDPVTNGTVSLYYYIAPAGYGDGTGQPEIPDVWRDMLVNGATLVTQAYIESVDRRSLDIEKILSALDSPIMLFKQQLEGVGYRRGRIVVHPSYNINTPRRFGRNI